MRKIFLLLFLQHFNEKIALITHEEVDLEANGYQSELYKKRLSYKI